MRTRLYNLELDLCGGAASLSRNGILLLTIKGVVSITEEHRYSARDHQHMSLLRFNGEEQQLFYVDHLDGHTNVREVSAVLADLESVLSWLLPAGYTHRQGDIGVYRRERLPSGVVSITSSFQPQEFAEVLGLRHIFKADAMCSFYKLEEACFVHVHAPTELLHPEHETVLLAEGIYELVKAKGESLSSPFRTYECKAGLLQI